jgi:hypothetical protein
VHPVPNYNPAWLVKRGLERMKGARYKGCKDKEGLTGKIIEMAEDI